MKTTYRLTSSVCSNHRATLFLEKVRCFCFTVFLLLLNGWLVTAFAQTFNAINYDTNDGLPSPEVYDLATARDGSLWLTTDRGVCRYDGYNFTTYTTRDGLTNNTNFEIWTDKDGRLWFNAFDGSLTYFEDGVFKAFERNDSLQYNLNGQYADALAEDPLGRLISWNSNSFSPTRAVDKDQMECVIIDRENREVWKEELRIEDTELQRGENIYNAAFLKAMLLSRAGWEFDDFLKIELSDDHFIYSESNYLFQCKDGFVSRVPFDFSARIDFLYLDSNDYLWACTHDGVFQLTLDRLDQPIRHYFQGLKITSVRMDREGNYWFSSIERGIFKIKNFEIEHLNVARTSTQNEIILSVTGLKNHLIFSTYSYKLMSVNRQLELGQIQQNSNFLYQFFSKLGDAVYYAPGRRIEEKDGRLQIYNFATNMNGPMLAISDTMLMAASGVSIRFFKQKNKEITLVGRSSRWYKRMTCIAEWPKNNFWLGTLDGIYTIKGPDFKVFESYQSGQSVFKTRYTQLELLGDKGLWGATMGNGLIFIGKNGHRQFLRKDGLGNTLINCLHLQNDSTLWVGSNKGAYKIRFRLDDADLPVFQSVQPITVLEGLASNHINDIEEWNDKIWLATDKGFDFFPADLPIAKAPPPLISLDSVIVDTSNLQKLDRPVLAYDQNNLIFYFTGISFSQPEGRPFYRYRLMGEGLDSNWIYTDARDVRFNKLAPGNYRFELMARNNDERWSDPAVQYDFRIRSHFIDLWWVRLLLLFLIGFISWLIYARRIQSIRFKEAQKRKLQRAELESLRSQMNPHFVFNSLNSIQNFIFKKDVRQANYYLSKFSRLMRDSLQFTRLKNISLDKEINFMQAYLELEQMRFPDRFSFAIQVQKDLPLHHYYVPPLLIQPVLENAVKHAFKNIDYKGELRVFVEVEETLDLLRIIVIDNGLGIEEDGIGKYNAETQHQSLGLRMIYDRIDLINETQPGVQASFRLENRQKLDASLSGTRATLQLPLNMEEA
ncbi:MAG: histidine kinase [Bacteroidota bacterium]